MKDNSIYGFLVLLLKKHKVLFTMVVGFIGLQIFFTIKGVENFPFLNYGMYSEKVDILNLASYQIYIDKKLIKPSNLIDCKRSLVIGSLQKYESLLEKNFIEREKNVINKRVDSILYPAANSYFKNQLLNKKSVETEYPKWLMSYLADMRFVKNPSLIVLSNKDTLINYEDRN
jgi:hypothetical protein